ncbi:uncharacterized protein LOC126839488 [Adelges cooleyi]|uniref:uncharacterized protein LOC126839488 n=1 Tax=Adelges cooleyi TaxID=133065 RepID=UPI0021806937|nr:uncharacterized protein LOC126839488 [Adelges cooleyi]
MNTGVALVTVAVLLATLQSTAVAEDLSAAGFDDPALDALAEGKAPAKDKPLLDDRSKRQLPSVQSKLLNFLKPLPVVDVTKEEEKYGNNGDKFNRFGRGIIGSVETLSSVLTSALSFPVDTAKKISRGATEALNNLGGRIVGLQR